MSESRVYKYHIEFQGGSYCTVEMPVGATVIKLAVQDGKDTIWAIIDPQAEDVEYKIMYSGTGWRLPADIAQWTYLDTIFSPGGTVWHYFLKAPK